MLTALNEAFLMEKHNNMYFTIWYGVYARSTRTLRYASAGHPPSLLINKDPTDKTTVQELGKPGMVLGGMPGTAYSTETQLVPPGSTLFLMSDGVYEITRPDETLWTFSEFTQLMAASADAGKPEIEELAKKVHNMHGTGPLDDDFSIVKLQFPA